MRQSCNRIDCNSLYAYSKKFCSDSSDAEQKILALRNFYATLEGMDAHGCQKHAQEIVANLVDESYAMIRNRLSGNISRLLICTLGLLSKTYGNIFFDSKIGEIGLQKMFEFQVLLTHSTCAECRILLDEVPVQGQELHLECRQFSQALSLCAQLAVFHADILEQFDSETMSDKILSLMLSTRRAFRELVGCVFEFLSAFLDANFEQSICLGEDDVLIASILSFLLSYLSLDFSLNFCNAETVFGKFAIFLLRGKFFEPFSRPQRDLQRLDQLYMLVTLVQAFGNKALAFYKEAGGPVCVREILEAYKVTIPVHLHVELLHRFADLT